MARPSTPTGNSNRVSGKIARVIADKGFFFVKGDEDQVDYFGHMSALEEATIHDLRPGQAVTYLPGQSEKGPRAEAIRLK